MGILVKKKLNPRFLIFLGLAPSPGIWAIGFIIYRGTSLVFYVLDFHSHVLVLDSRAGGVVLDLRLSDQKIVIQNYQYAALEDGNRVILRTTTFIQLSSQYQRSKGAYTVRYHFNYIISAKLALPPAENLCYIWPEVHNNDFFDS